MSRRLSFLDFTNLHYNYWAAFVVTVFTLLYTPFSVSLAPDDTL